MLACRNAYTISLVYWHSRVKSKQSTIRSKVMQLPVEDAAVWIIWAHNLDQEYQAQALQCSNTPSGWHCEQNCSLLPYQKHVRPLSKARVQYFTAVPCTHAPVFSTLFCHTMLACRTSKKTLLRHSLVLMHAADLPMLKNHSGSVVALYCIT